MIPSLRTSGIATVLGYLLVFVLLFRHPLRALDAVNADLPGTVYFVGFPAAGVLAGVCAARELPGSLPLLVLAGSTLIGVAVLRPIGPVEAELPVALALGGVFLCGLLATVGGVLGSWRTVLAATRAR